MLVNRDVVERFLESHMRELAFKNTEAQTFYKKCNDTYEIPAGLVADFVTGRRRLEEATDFILFIMLDCLDTKQDMIKKYYTGGEIDFYRKSKYQDESKIVFPITFKMVQVAPDQYIGKTDVQTLMKLKNSQKVKYNENTQRVKQRVVKGNIEYYKITLNKVAVQEIAEAFRDERYISDDITLNILDDNADYSYDERTCNFIIKSISEFDIIDGYHRWVAMNRIIEADPNFNYPMELRITTFGEDKARNFVYQKDQKTRMAKIDSDSFNMNSAANIVVTRLNESVRCNLKGAIKHNGGLISAADLGDMVRFFYMKSVKKENERVLTQQVLKDLIEDFNIITDENYEYLEKRYEFKELLGIMYVFSKYKFAEDKSGLYDDVQIVTECIKKIDNSKLYRKRIGKTMINLIEKTLKEEGKEVKGSNVQ